MSRWNMDMDDSGWKEYFLRVYFQRENWVRVYFLLMYFLKVSIQKVYLSNMCFFKNVFPEGVVFKCIYCNSVLRHQCILSMRNHFHPLYMACPLLGEHFAQATFYLLHFSVYQLFTHPVHGAWCIRTVFSPDDGSFIPKAGAPMHALVTAENTPRIL